MNILFNDNISMARYLTDIMYNKVRSTSIYAEYDDMYQESLLGLYRATKLYNPKNNTKFSTYAYKAINSFILRYIIKINGYKSNLIIKSDANTLTNKIIKYMNSNENYTIEDISINFGISKKKTKNMLSLINNVKKGAVRIDDCEDSLAYKNDSNYLDQIGIEIDIEKLLGVLNEHERDVIKSYYGLGSNAKKYELIGNAYGCSKQRIQQIVNGALRKLRKNVKSELIEYISR